MTASATSAFQTQQHPVDDTKAGKAGTLTRFNVEAVATAQTPSRLLEHFAQRDLLPSRVTSHIEGCSLHVVIEQPDLDIHCASIIAEKMRSAVRIERVELSSLA